MPTLAPEKSAVDKFGSPLYSIAEAARYLGMNDGTFRSWARGYTTHIGIRTVTGKPIITDLGRPGQRGPAIPFVVLADGYALAAIRKAGVPLQRIRPALDRLSEEIGLGHHWRPNVCTPTAPRCSTTTRSGRRRRGGGAGGADGGPPC